ncbi:putative F-box protein [Salvia divinorum]|uniref:F-box protein n=1 Tax=Salvia divinorum TaxID=28513 RepID=A0ABD1FSN3_SALDI
MDSSPNDDVVTEILLHLPFTSLLRSRSSCKSWRDQIDSQPFRKLHIQQHADDDDDRLLVQFSFRQEGVSELSMFSWNSSKLYNNFAPASQEILDNHLKVGITSHPLPNPNGHIDVFPPLWFEPNSHRTLCRDVGIWFDKVAQDYVVVQFLSCFGNGFHENSLENGFQLHAWVYSKAKNSWRPLAGGSIVGHGVSVLDPIKSSCKNSSFSHWLALGNAGKAVILSFDFRNEGFNILEIADFGILKDSEKDMEIFEEGDDSFLIGKAPMWFDICWMRIEENMVQWGFLKSVGPFASVIPMALCERGCVILQSKNRYLLLYDYCCYEEYIEVFEMKKDEIEILEYRGSFVLP